MHDRWRGLRRDRLDVLWWDGRHGLPTELLGPGLRAHTPRGRTRLLVSWLCSVAPDMDNFDHSGLAAAGPTTASPSLDEPLLAGEGMRPLPLSGRENTICFCHELP